jgi:hypothetical protein
VCLVKSVNVMSYIFVDIGIIFVRPKICICQLLVCDKISD